MYRSIKTLRRTETEATDEEVHAASLQFVAEGERLPGPFAGQRRGLPRRGGRDRRGLPSAPGLPQNAAVHRRGLAPVGRHLSDNRRTVVLL